MLNVAAYVNRLLNETASNKQMGVKKIVTEEGVCSMCLK